MSFRSRFRVRVRPYYVAVAAKIPKISRPLCIGVGLPKYRNEARTWAEIFALEVMSSGDLKGGVR